MIGCKTFEGVQPSAEIIGIDEVCEMALELLVVIIVVSLDGSFFDRSVHSFDLAFCPRVPDFG